MVSLTPHALSSGSRRWSSRAPACCNWLYLSHCVDIWLQAAAAATAAARSSSSSGGNSSSTWHAALRYVTRSTHSTAASAVRLVHCCRSCAHSAQLVARTVHVVHCCGSSACGARLVAQRCVVCTAVVAVRQLHSWPRPGAFWALLLDHLKSCENPTSSPARARVPARARGPWPPATGGPRRGTSAIDESSSRSSHRLEYKGGSLPAAAV